MTILLTVYFKFVLEPPVVSCLIFIYYSFPKRVQTLWRVARTQCNVLSKFVSFSISRISNFFKETHPAQKSSTFIWQIPCPEQRPKIYLLQKNGGQNLNIVCLPKEVTLLLRNKLSLLKYWFFSGFLQIPEFLEFPSCNNSKDQIWFKENVKKNKHFAKLLKISFQWPLLATAFCQKFILSWKWKANSKALKKMQLLSV